MKCYKSLDIFRSRLIRYTRNKRRKKSSFLVILFMGLFFFFRKKNFLIYGRICVFGGEFFDFVLSKFERGDEKLNFLIDFNWIFRFFKRIFWGSYLIAIEI